MSEALKNSTKQKKKAYTGSAGPHSQDSSSRRNTNIFCHKDEAAMGRRLQHIIYTH